MSGIGEPFTCGRCRGTFGKGRSDEEALAEARSTWTPEAAAGEPVILCDPCYQEFMEWARVNIQEDLL